MCVDREAQEDGGGEGGDETEHQRQGKIQSVEGAVVYAILCVWIEKHRKMEEEREEMRQSIRDKVRYNL